MESTELTQKYSQQITKRSAEGLARHMWTTTPEGFTQEDEYTQHKTTENHKLKAASEETH